MAAGHSGNHRYIPLHRTSLKSALYGINLLVRELLFSGILSLLPMICPPTIIRLIIPICVYPIEGVPFRTRPHIFAEAFERMQPLVANFYSAPAVMLEGYMIGIRAALAHSSP